MNSPFRGFASRRSTIARPAFILLLGATAATAQAQAPQDDTLRLTIAAARSAALRGNPELLAARSEIAIARGQLRQAGILRFNPSADVLGLGWSTGSEIGLSQEIEIAGQQGVRRAVARSGVARAEFLVADAARVTLSDVDRGFYRSVAADRRAILANEILGLNERLAQVATKQLAAGEISKLDYNLSVIELGRSRARAVAARRERLQSGIELRRLAGLPAGIPLAAAFDSAVHRHVAMDSGGIAPRMDLRGFGAGADTSIEPLVQGAIGRRPDLAERSAAVTQTGEDVTLARREALPNLAARIVSQRNELGTGRTLRPGIGLSIPIFNRHQGEVESRMALAERTRLERAAIARRVRADVEGAVRSYEAAAGEVEVLERTVLGPARDNRRLLEAAYREGKVGLPVLLLIRNQVIDAEQDYWTAWLAERVAEADLRAALALPMSDDTRGRP